MDVQARRIDRTLRVAVRRLTATSESPELDTEILLAYVLGRDRSHLRAWPERLLDDSEARRFEELIDARHHGTPVAYLTGEREFWSLSLAVSSAVLIPRPETEHLVALALDRLPARGRLLDLGTGSGAIAVAIAHERPDARVVATDVSAAALDVAAVNVARHAPDGVILRHGEWFACVAGERFDVVVSNPPYVDENEPELCLGDVRFEPTEALIAATHGMQSLHHVVDNATGHLVPGGHCLLEHGWRQGPPVRRRMHARRWTSVTTHRDLAGHERVTSGILPG